MSKDCSGGCGRTLDRRNTSGRCRSCFWGPVNSDPERTAKRIANLRVTLARPDQRARLVARCRANSRVRMAWCPEKYQDEYRRLTRSAMMSAAEARAAIEAQVVRDKEREAAARPDISTLIAASHDRLKRGGGHSATAGKSAALVACHG